MVLVKEEKKEHCRTTQRTFSYKKRFHGLSHYVEILVLKKALGQKADTYIKYEFAFRLYPLYLC